MWPRAWALWSARRCASCRLVGWHIQQDAAALGQSSQLLSSPWPALRLSCHRPWAEWLSITPGSLHGFPPQRGFSFSPAAIFRGLGSTDMPPSNAPVARPGWGPWPPTQAGGALLGALRGPGSSPDSRDTRLTERAAGMAGACSGQVPCLFSAKGRITGLGAQNPTDGTRL